MSDRAAPGTFLADLEHDERALSDRRNRLLEKIARLEAAGAPSEELDALRREEEDISARRQKVHLTLNTLLWEATEPRSNPAA
jgi:chromatin segregation and condensation protein Rec8/ScpA/Scc1 (kleisin family)